MEAKWTYFHLAQIMNSALRKFFSSPVGTVLFHLFIWTSLFILQYTLGTPFRGGGRFHEDQPQALPLTFIFLTIMAAVFYLNYYLLLPRVFINNRYFSYLGAIGASAIVFVIVMKGLSAFAFTNVKYHKPSIVISFFPFIFMWAISTALRLTNDRVAEEKEKKERENESLKSELSFLRSQISPHFMFNVMNSIVSLSRKQPQKVEPVVIQLSQLMRYMLYDSDEAKVTLDMETAYLQNYIDLQKLRFGESVKVVFEKAVEGEGSIEPMLLIPFVENAFKHGVGMVKDPVIYISLSLKERRLRFKVNNKFNPLEESPSKDNNSGIGLKNVTRRLSLLYRDRCDLKISSKDNCFAVDLSIDFLA